MIIMMMCQAIETLNNPGKKQSIPENAMRKIKYFYQETNPMPITLTTMLKYQICGCVHGQYPMHHVSYTIACRAQKVFILS